MDEIEILTGLCNELGYAVEYDDFHNQELPKERWLYGIVSGKYMSVIIDQFLTTEETIETLAHELGHIILRHGGNLIENPDEALEHQADEVGDFLRHFIKLMGVCSPEQLCSVTCSLMRM